MGTSQHRQSRTRTVIQTLASEPILITTIFTTSDILMFSREIINPVSHISGSFQNFRSHLHTPWHHRNNMFMCGLWLAQVLPGSWLWPRSEQELPWALMHATCSPSEGLLYARHHAVCSTRTITLSVSHFNTMREIPQGFLLEGNIKRKLRHKAKRYMAHGQAWQQAEAELGLKSRQVAWDPIPQWLCYTIGTSSSRPDITPQVWGW